MGRKPAARNLARNGNPIPKAAPSILPWPYLPIGTVGEVRSGRQRSEKIIRGNRRKYLRVANVFDGLIDYSDVFEMPFTEAEEITYSLRPGDILLNEGQSLELVGRSAIYDGLPGAYCFQNTLIRFRPSTQITSEFAQQVFQHYVATGRFSSVASRTTSIAHLGVDRFAKLRIPVPPIPEQLAITAVLSTWDQAIGKTAALIEAKRRHKVGLVQQILSHDKRFAAAKRNWQTYHIGELLMEVRRYVDVNDDTSYRLVSVRRRSAGIFEREPTLGREIGYSKLMKIETGDFLIARRQVIHGAMSSVRDRFDGAFVSDAYATLVPKTANVLHMPFFDVLSHTPEMYHAAYRCSYGVAREKMVFNLEWFLREKVLIPPTIDEQVRVANLFAAMAREIRYLKRRLDALKGQKLGLMQQLLTGKMQVPARLRKAVK